MLVAMLMGEVFKVPIGAVDGPDEEDEGGSDVPDGWKLFVDVLRGEEVEEGPEGF